MFSNYSPALLVFLTVLLQLTNGQIQKADISGTYSWGGFTSDETGTYLTAAQKPSSGGTNNSPQMIYYSKDGGSTWSQSSAPAVGYYCIAAASSAASYVVTGGYNGIYLSTNYGESWSQSSSFIANAAAAISSNGQIMTLAKLTSNGCVAYSSSYGSTWTTGLGPTGLTSNCETIAMNADGDTLVLGTDSSGIYFSNNNGHINSIAYGGGIFYAGMISSPYYILISTDSGITWQISSGSISTSPAVWQLAVAANLGSYVVVGASDLYVTTNSGVNYTELSENQGKTRAVAVNGDGTLAMYNYGNSSISYLYYGNLVALTPTLSPTAISNSSTLSSSVAPTTFPSDPTYAISNYYSDPTCTEFTSMETLVLNVCLRASAGNFFKITCGSGTLINSFYSDSICSKFTGSNTFPLNSGCNVNGQPGVEYYDHYFVAIACGTTGATDGYPSSMITQTYFMQNGDVCDDNEIIGVNGYVNDLCLQETTSTSGKIDWSNLNGYSYSSANCQGTPTIHALTTECTISSSPEYGIAASYYCQGPSSANSDSNSSDLSSGAIAGIAIGGVGFIILLIAIGYFFFIKSRIPLNKQEISVQDMNKI